MRVLKLGSYLDLTPEPAPVYVCDQLRGQQLDDDLRPSERSVATNTRLIPPPPSSRSMSYAWRGYLSVAARNWSLRDAVAAGMDMVPREAGGRIFEAFSDGCREGRVVDTETAATAEMQPKDGISEREPMREDAAFSGFNPETAVLSGCDRRSRSHVEPPLRSLRSLCLHRAPEIET